MITTSTRVEDAKLHEMQQLAGLPFPPTEATYAFRQAVSGEGDRAFDWQDKPHRLVYDLCRIIEADAWNRRSASPSIGRVTDSMVEAALRGWYPGWDTEDRPKATDGISRAKMRAALAAALVYHEETAGDPQGAGDPVAWMTADGRIATDEGHRGRIPGFCRAQRSKGADAMTTEEQQLVERLKPSYVADKAAIEAAVQLRDKHPLLTEALNKAIVANNALKSEAAAALAASEAKVAELQEALKPFAKAADVKLCGEWRDDERFGHTDITFHLTFGDLRAARRALEASK